MRANKVKHKTFETEEVIFELFNQMIGINGGVLNWKYSDLSSHIEERREVAEAQKILIEKYFDIDMFI